MTARSLIVSAAAALVAGALLSTGAFAAAPSVSASDITKFTASKADKSQVQIAQEKKKKGKAKKKGKKKQG